MIVLNPVGLYSTLHHYVSKTKQNPGNYFMLATTDNFEIVSMNVYLHIYQILRYPTVYPSTYILRHLSIYIRNDVYF